MPTTDAPRILVIDDNARLRSSLASALDSVGYNVRTGSNGREGVTIARDFKPAVVICDMHMPHTNGSEVLKTLRQEENFALSQFILMTGDLDGTPQRVGMNFGADDYLAKPFTVDEFLNCVSARLQRSQLYKKAEDRALTHFRETITLNLPHEVFTPLTSILGFTEVLSEEISRISPAEAGKMITEIHFSAERLYRTLKNYLRILEVLNDKNSRVQSGAPIRFPAVPGVVLQAAQSTAAQHGRQETLKLVCPEVDVPVPTTDLTTIVTELVDNACKYSASGTPVEVRLRSTPESIILVVSDHGRGMTPDEIAHIGAFQQFDRNKYEQQGLGLGLTLTQHLIEKHGGKLHLKSTPEVGTIVTATWPRPA